MKRTVAVAGHLSSVNRMSANLAARLCEDGGKVNGNRGVSSECLWRESGQYHPR